MATSDVLLSILLKARDEASAILDGTAAASGRMRTSFDLAKAAVGTFGAAGVGLLSDMAREGADDAASMRAVEVAVNNAGGAWTTAEPQLGAFIDRMRDTGAVADDKTKPALSGLIAVTGDVEKSMTLAALAADLARGKNIDYNTAAELLGKVAMGNTSILKRYGITLDENASSEEALAELQKRFAGQAEAYGETTKGQIETLGLKVGDFREQVGQATGPAMGFIAILPGLSTGFSIAGGAIGGLMPVLGLLRTALMTQAIPAIGATVLAMGPVLIPIALISGAIALFTLAWSQNWGDIQGKTEAARDAIGEVMGSLGKTVQEIWDGMVGNIKGAINGIIGLINSFIRAVNNIKIEVPSVDIPLVGKVGGFTVGMPQIPTIPMLAAGGVVMRPTLAVLGERGPEAVLPLTQFAFAGSGGGGLTVNMQGARFYGIDDAEDRIVAAIQRAQRRGRL